MEPSLSTTTQRLTSFRIPRDLTLGGNVKIEKPKKIYTPNINAQRNKKKDDTTPVKVDTVKSKYTGTREHGRGRGKGDRGRGRGNLIQSVGVWSEGISVPVVSRKYSSSESSSTADTKKVLEKPKLNINKIVDKAEEEETLKKLLQDDFIDDGTDVDMDSDFITLPIIIEGELYKKETKIKTDVHNDEEDIDEKPIVSENGKVINIKKGQKLKAETSTRDIKEPIINRISQIIKNRSNSYTLIQLPSYLPDLEPNKEESRPKRPNDSRSNTHSENDNKAKTNYCIFNNLKGGFLGKLEILKSGKARLRLGENNFVVNIGSHPSFRQDLLAAKVDTLSLKGDLINLGSVNETLICSPYLESLLGNV